MGPNPNGSLRKLLELLDTQVFSGSVQWVLLEISWIWGLHIFERKTVKFNLFDFMVLSMAE